jgi:hypothetical protein
MSKLEAWFGRKLEGEKLAKAISLLENLHSTLEPAVLIMKEMLEGMKEWDKYLSDKASKRLPRGYMPEQWPESPNNPILQKIAKSRCKHDKSFTPFSYDPEVLEKYIFLYSEVEHILKKAKAGKLNKNTLLDVGDYTYRLGYCENNNIRLFHHKYSEIGHVSKFFYWNNEKQFIEKVREPLHKKLEQIGEEIMQTAQN